MDSDDTSEKPNEAYFRGATRSQTKESIVSTGDDMSEDPKESPSASSSHDSEEAFQCDATDCAIIEDECQCNDLHVFFADGEDQESQDRCKAESDYEDAEPG